MDARKRVPVIIDTDPGVDDVVAILLALASPELEILAYLISFGNTDVHLAYENIYKLYQAVGRHISAHPEASARFPNYTPEVPPVLAMGPEGPIADLKRSAKYFHGSDGLGDISKTHPDLNVSPEDKANRFHANFTTTTKSGMEVASQVLQSRPERSITYIVIGPLTGLALLLRHHREVVRERIGRVIIMGGALDVPGNSNPVAECRIPLSGILVSADRTKPFGTIGAVNISADAHAAKEVLCPDVDVQGHGLPLDRVLLLPLDITTMHEIPFPFYIKHIDPTFESTRKPSVPSEKSPLCHFTSSFLERTREAAISFRSDALELHDIAAIWCAIENPPVPADEGHDLIGLSPGWEVTRRKFDIERLGELTVGMMVVDRRNDATAYAPGSNRAQVQALLKKHHHPVGLLESNVLPAQVEVEESEISNNGGVPCVVETPGPAALLRLLTKRVWGVDLSEDECSGGTVLDDVVLEYSTMHRILVTAQ